mgnify:CR=1 FL=1
MVEPSTQTEQPDEDAFGEIDDYPALQAPDAGDMPQTLTFFLASELVE